MKKGEPLGFSDIHCVASEPNEGEVQSKKFQKKSHSAEKSVGGGAKGDPKCVFEVLDVFCFFFSFWTRF